MFLMGHLEVICINYLFFSFQGVGGGGARSSGVIEQDVPRYVEQSGPEIGFTG